LRLCQGTASLGLKTDKSGDAHRHAQQLDCGDRMYLEFRPDRRLAPLVECGWVRSVHIFAILDGQITRHRAVRDGLALLLQLGWRPGG
jgi:hypothetical protein